MASHAARSVILEFIVILAIAHNALIITAGGESTLDRDGRCTFLCALIVVIPQILKARFIDPVGA